MRKGEGSGGRGSGIARSCPVAQRVKDPEGLQLGRRLHLQRGFDPQPGNFHIPWMQPKKRAESEIAKIQQAVAFLN